MIYKAKTEVKKKKKQTGRKYRFQHGSSICCCLVNLNIWLRLVFELQIFGSAFYS
jgi:hypothetical protein